MCMCVCVYVCVCVHVHDVCVWGGGGGGGGGVHVCIIKTSHPEFQIDGYNQPSGSFIVTVTFAVRVNI